MRKETCYLKCSQTSQKCPYNWDDPLAGDVARDNCPLYSREDEINPEERENGRKVRSDFCAWLTRESGGKLSQ